MTTNACEIYDGIRKSMYLSVDYHSIYSPSPNQQTIKTCRLFWRERICTHLLINYLLTMVGKANHAEKAGGLHLSHTISISISRDAMMDSHCWDPMRTTKHWLQDAPTRHGHMGL